MKPDEFTVINGPLGIVTRLIGESNEKIISRSRFLYCFELFII